MITLLSTKIYGMVVRLDLSRVVRARLDTIRFFECASRSKGVSYYKYDFIFTVFMLFFIFYSPLTLCSPAGGDLDRERGRRDDPGPGGRQGMQQVPGLRRVHIIGPRLVTERAHGHPLGAFDRLVTVVERPAEGPREQAPDGRLAGAHEPYQDDRPRRARSCHRRQSSPGGTSSPAWPSAARG